MATTPSQTVAPLAPNFWDTQRWGELLNRMDYHARCFLRTDPTVWEYLVTYTRQMLAVAQSRDQHAAAMRAQLSPVEQGRLTPPKPERIGIKCCVERMRYEVWIKRGRYNDKFKFPNEYTSYFARLLAVAISDLADRVVTRKIVQEPQWQASLVAGTLTTP